MKKHFVVFQSPGTMVAENSTMMVPKWDVEQAMKMAKDIKERHSATPYGFYFITRSRNDDQLDSEITDSSGMYYLGGEIQTLEEIEARNDPKDEILISNMKCNKWNQVIVNTNSYRITLPFTDEDTRLNWNP